MSVTAMKRNEILDIIKTDEAQRNFFFREVQDPEWLPWLETAGYLDTNNAPAPVVDSQGTLYPEWEVLPFLARIAEKSSSDAIAKQQIPRLIAFFSKVTSSHAGNWRTLYWLSRILSSLPREQVSIDMIKSVRGWLLTAGHVDMISAELCSEFLPKVLAGPCTTEDVEKAELLLDIILTTVEIEPAKRISTWSETHRFVLEDYWVRTGVEKCFDQIASSFTASGISRIKYSIQTLLVSAATHRDREIEIGDRSARIAFSEDSKELLLTVMASGQEGVIGTRKIPLSATRDQLVSELEAWLVQEKLVAKETSPEWRNSLRRVHAQLMGQYCESALDDHSTWREKNPLGFLVRTFWEILDRRQSGGDQSTKQIVESLFDESLLLFPKISLFLIGRHPEQLHELFWVGLKSRNGDVLLEELFFGIELKEALGGLPVLSNSQREILNKCIEGGSILWSEDTDQEYKIFWKQQRYGALSADPIFAQKYSEIKQKTGRDAHLRAALGPVECIRGFGKSPISPEELHNESCEKIAQFLHDFKPGSFWEGPTIGGMADALETAVRQKPEHFLSGLGSFHQSAYLWVARILRGLKEASSDPQTRVWERIIPFIETYTKDEAFWKNQLAIRDIDSVFHPDYEWVVGEFCMLVENACREDAKATVDGDLDRIRTLLHGWLARTQWPIKQVYDEPVMQAINATSAKAVEALLQLTLCIARRKFGRTPSDAVKWDDSDRLIIESLLKQDAVEVFTLLGMYLPNLFYLDRGWTNSTLPILTDNKYSKEFLVGFLHHAGYYDDLYRKLSKSYIAAYQLRNLDERSIEAIIEHATLAYVRGVDSLQGEGLFGLIIQKCNPEDIQRIVGFVGRLAIGARNEDDKINYSKIAKSAPRVLNLWRKILELIKDHPELEKISSELYANLIEFSGFISELDVDTEGLICETLKAGVPSNREYPFFLEYLLEVFERRPDADAVCRLGRIYLQLLESCTPSFRKESIIEIVEHLFKNQESRAYAQKVCEHYGRKTNDFLKPVFDKYNGNEATSG